MRICLASWHATQLFIQLPFEEQRLSDAFLLESDWLRLSAGFVNIQLRLLMMNDILGIQLYVAGFYAVAAEVKYYIWRGGASYPIPTWCKDLRSSLG